MLWQTEPNPCDNHRVALKKYYHRRRERDRKRWSTHTKQTTRAKWNYKKRVSVAAVLWWAMCATCLWLSSSWFLILLAEIPLQSPPLSACLRHSADSLSALCSAWPDIVSVVFCCFVHGSCTHRCLPGPTLGLMGQIWFCRGYSGYFNILTCKNRWKK